MRGLLVSVAVLSLIGGITGGFLTAYFADKAGLPIPYMVSLAYIFGGALGAIYPLALDEIMDDVKSMREELREYHRALEIQER